MPTTPPLATLTTARQVQDIPPGSTLRDKDGARLVKLGNMQLRYIEPESPADVQHSIHNVLLLWGPLDLLTVPGA